MTIFAVLLPRDQEALAKRIEEAFPSTHKKINSTQWLVASTATVIEVTARLGIYDSLRPDEPPTGNAIVFATAGYFGRAPKDIWEWIKRMQESV